MTILVEEKSSSFSLNLRDVRKLIPPAIASVLGFYIANTEMVNMFLIQAGISKELLTAIFPLLTYLGTLFLKWNKDDSQV